MWIWLRIHFYNSKHRNKPRLCITSSLLQWNQPTLSQSYLTQCSRESHQDSAPSSFPQETQVIAHYFVAASLISIKCIVSVRHDLCISRAPGQNMESEHLCQSRTEWMFKFFVFFQDGLNGSFGALKEKMPFKCNSWGTIDLCMWRSAFGAPPRGRIAIDFFAHICYFCTVVSKKKSLLLCNRLCLSLWNNSVFLLYLRRILE